MCLLIFIKDWTKHFSTQPEILGYLKDVTRKYNLYPHIRFQTRVESLRWDAPAAKWIAVIFDKCTGRKETHHYDIIANGTGMLRLPNIPDQFAEFKQKVHSAEWDPSITLSGKRVGVVGTGASAIQIVPAIADEVDKLTVFQRRPPYLVPKLQVEYPDFFRWACANVPGIRLATRTTVFWMQELIYTGFKHNTLGAKILEKISYFWRRSQMLDDAVLLKKMTPDYEFGCKRVLPSNDYYPTLQKPNVKVNSNRIVKVTDNAIETEDGETTELDVSFLVLITNFIIFVFFLKMKNHSS